MRLFQQSLRAVSEMLLALSSTSVLLLRLVPAYSLVSDRSRLKTPGRLTDREEVGDGGAQGLPQLVCPSFLEAVRHVPCERVQPVRRSRLGAPIAMSATDKAWRCEQRQQSEPAAASSTQRRCPCAPAPPHAPAPPPAPSAVLLP